MRDLSVIKRVLAMVFFTTVMMLGIYSSSNAIPVSEFSNPANGWTQFTNPNSIGGIYGEDGVVYKKYGSSWYWGYVDPGWGGQSFDAEHLFYKLQGDILSIGLQTGFDLGDGKYSEGGTDYYAGDLALSFDGDTTNYEYAADFGLKTRDYATPQWVGGNTGISGQDTAGLYKVNSTGWNNDVVLPDFSASKPFAMKTGELQIAFNSSTSLYDTGFNAFIPPNLPGKDYPAFSTTAIQYGGFSHYRIVSFPVTLIEGIGNTFNLNAHWTMSCGNDAINGSVTIQRPVVPEPGTMFLLGSLATGLFGFAGLRRRFTK